ncbi:MAG: hypothetical protein FWG48_00665 [Oscillospiraceae bacterium]|nr:hypothetical protein [Oscillospiraceae bacterium]
MALALVLAIVLAFAPGAAAKAAGFESEAAAATSGAALSTGAATRTANPTASTVIVNGRDVAFDSYNIGGSNYFKLRDLAFVIRESVKRFEVRWDAGKNAISLITGRIYTTVGGEMASKGVGAKTATPTKSSIFLNEREMSFEAYTIEGNNYFKLRDIGSALNFGVEWDAARNTIRIDTSKRYTPDDRPFSYADSYFGATQGSVKQLEGRTVLVSIFVATDYSLWGDLAIHKFGDSLRVVKDYIEDEGSKYGKDIDLICDFEEHPELRYDVSFSGEFYVHPNDGVVTGETQALADSTAQFVYDFIEENIPYEQLAEKYQTDSIGYVAFFSGAEGRSYAFQYGAGYTINRYHETAVIIGMVAPSIIAHEVLHLFSATDWYLEEASYGVDDSVINYVKANYSEDIMLATRSYDDNGDLIYDSILKEITPMTAYSVGWLDDIPELDIFPLLRRKIPSAVVFVMYDFQGERTWKYSTGTYTGGFVNGYQWGYGVFAYTNGNEYAGYWEFGKANGMGTYKQETSTYTGQFLDGYYHGQGVIEFDVGTKYEGSFENGAYSGYGVYSWADGHEYSGMWENSKQSGQGIMKYPDGSVKEGVWKDGQYIS